LLSKSARAAGAINDRQPSPTICSRQTPFCFVNTVSEDGDDDDDDDGFILSLEENTIA
jgi:hypothetical protein